MFRYLFDAYLVVFRPTPRRAPALPAGCRTAAESLPPLPIGRRRSRPQRRAMVIGRP